MAVKILHTSDIHLGAKFNFLGNKSDDYRNKLKQTFSNIISTALKEQVDLILIAGDLFDSPYPSEATTSFVKQEFTRLNESGIKVVIIAGNHDAYSQGSIYERKIFSDLPNIRVLETKGEIFEISELDLSIYGKSRSGKRDKGHFLDNIKKSPNTKLHVGLFHIGFNIEGKIDDESLLSKEDISNSGLNYIALGDWHGQSDYSQGDVKCFFSGSPEPIDFSQKKAGSVLLIEINSEGTKVSSLSIGSTIIKQERLEIQSEAALEIRDFLTKISNKDMVLLLEITGRLDVGIEKTIEEIEEEFRTKFYYLKIKNKATIDLSGEDIKKLRQDPFINTFFEKIEKYSGVEKYKNVIDDALQIGLEALSVEGK